MAKRVLVVDDEKDVLTSVKYLVEREGFEARVARSAKGALALLRKEKFDLVLMDIFMPKVSGRECVERIRKEPKLRRQKVAFLTVAQLSEAGRDAIKKLKPAGYIQKPIDIEDFGRELKKLLK